jgi:hypothetical protein
MAAKKTATTAKKAPVAAKKPAARTSAAKKPAAKATAKAATAKRAAPAMKHGPRADYGAPVDAFFARQTGPLKPVVDELRAMVQAAAPKATAKLKWGMPLYELDGETLCAIAAHKSHVNLILPGPDGTYADPQGLLSGEGKTGRHLKIQDIASLPKAAIRGWLATSAKRAKG